MTQRTVKDAAGRIWNCTSDTDVANATEHMGRDVAISCTTPTVDEPVRLTVGWQWLGMSDNGLGRLITTQSPAPKR